MATVSLGTYTVAELRRALEDFPPDAPVLAEWSDGLHLVDCIAETETVDPEEPVVVLCCDWRRSVNPIRSIHPHDVLP